MKIKKKKLIKIIAPILIVLLSLLLAKHLFSSRDKKPSSVAKERIWRVETLPAQIDSHSISLKLYGKIESQGLSHLSAPAMGIVTNLTIEEGNYVKKDQVLLSLAAEDFQPDLDSAKSKFNDIDSQIEIEKLQHQTNKNSLVLEKKLLNLKKASLKRSIDIHKKKLNSKSNIDDLNQLVIQQQISINKLKLQISLFPARLNRLESQLEQAQNTIDKAQLAVQRSIITAPFDAYISAVNTAVGNQVNSSSQLISLYPTSALEVRAKLPIQYKNSFMQNKTNSSQAIIKGTINNTSDSSEVVLKRIAAQASASGIDVFFKFSSNEENNNQVYHRIGEVVSIDVSLPAQDELIPIPYSSLYGQNDIYRIMIDDKGEQRLELIKIEVAGELSSKGKQSLLLIHSKIINKQSKLTAADQIVVTHLPNAITGLKVKAVSTEKVFSEDSITKTLDNPVLKKTVIENNK